LPRIKINSSVEFYLIVTIFIKGYATNLFNIAFYK